jgi:thiamine kinase-like enzyme
MSAGAPTMALAAAPAEVREALASFAAGRELLTQPAAHVHALAGGVENRVWRVIGPHVDWVVRLGGERDARLAVDRRRELACVTLAASHGFAPGIVHAGPEGGLLVTTRVAGRTWSRDDARAPRNVARFAARLRALHAVPVPSSLTPVDPRAVIE